MNLIIILACVAVGLWAIVTFTEKTDSEQSMAQAKKFSRWIWPLVMISLIAQLIYMMIGH